MKIAYDSYGAQPSNPEGDAEVYVMNALDGSDQRNLFEDRGAMSPTHSPTSKLRLATSVQRKMLGCGLRAGHVRPPTYKNWR